MLRTKLTCNIDYRGLRFSPFIVTLCLRQLLGRGDKISEFIKRGEEYAEVEIVLCTGEERDLVVYRKIKKDNSSDWKLNGQTSTLTKVAETIAKLNVQLDNLCQVHYSNNHLCHLRMPLLKYGRE